MSILEAARRLAEKKEKERAAKEANKPQNTQGGTSSNTTQTNNSTTGRYHSARVSEILSASANLERERAAQEKAETKKYTDYNTETKNVYTSTKDKLNSRTTITSKLTEKERKARIKEIDAELSTLNAKINGYSRAKVYGTSKAMLDAEKKDKERLAQLIEEKKSLERTGTFTASELKQFEIDDAKARVSSANARVNSYGARPTANNAESYRQAVSEQYKAQEELRVLERQMELYDNITKYGDVVNNDNNEASDKLEIWDGFSIPVPKFMAKDIASAKDFSSQWRANYRSNELSREADKAMSRYMDNPTEENRDIAYAYDAFAKAYAENNKKALDDENVKASWLTKSMAGYLPQFTDQILPELVGGGVGALLGGAVGAPTVGMSVGAGLATGIQSYNVMRGSVYRTLLAEGVDEEIALQAANDEALISSLIEGGETALSWLLAGGTKAVKAVTGAAKSSVAKGSTNAATKFIANLATNKAASKATAEAAKPLWRKGLGVAFDVAKNGASEYIEEYTQGAVSRANRERALSGIPIGGKGQLVKGASEVIADAITGKDLEARAELHEQGWEGAKIGLMFGGTNATVNNIVYHYVNAKTVKEQNEVVDAIIKDEEDLKLIIEEGKASGKGTVSAKIAEEVEKASEKGEVTREQVKKLIASTSVYAEAENQTDANPLEQAAREVVEERNIIKTALGDGEKAVGIADGQAYVSNGNVFIPVNDAEVAKTEYGASDSKQVGNNVSKLLTQSDFTPISENPIEGNIEGIGTVHIFTDTNGREIALKKDVAEYLEGNNLEATFRGGKPYAIKATDNDGNVAGVAMAVGMDRSGQNYQTTEANSEAKSNVPYNVMANDNPLIQDRLAREAHIKDATGFGQYGVQAFANVMEATPENQAPAVARVFQAAYELGLTNLDTAKANLPTAMHRIAFNAGKQDYIMENVGKVENVKNVKSHGDKAGFDSTNVPETVSKQAVDIFDKFCAELGVKAYMTGDSDDYNANITPNVGAVQIARNFDVLDDLGDDAASKSFLLHGLHEVAGHRAEELAPEEFAEFKREMYAHKKSLVGGASLADIKRQAYSEKGEDISLSDAVTEVTANSIFELYDNDINLLAEGLDRVLKGDNAKAKKGANIFKQALDYIIDKFNKFLGKLGIEARKPYDASLDELTRIRDLFEKALGAAIAKNKEIAKTNLVSMKDGTIVDAKGNVVAQINEDGTATFSLKTYDETGRAELKKWLDKNVKNKKLTETEAKDISEQLEYLYGICKQYEDKYAPFSAWSKAEVVKGLDGKPLMSVVKANGDYSMNLDFSLVCKKRRPLDALYRAMIDDGFMDNIGQLSEVEVARINEIIRKNGFETACTLCFVDSKRYRQYAVADSFVSKYNELVKMLAPEGAKVDHFDFSGKREASADGLHTMSNADLKAGINKLNKVIKEHGESTVVGKIANHLKAVAKDRKLVRVSDFMDSEGFVRVKQANPDVFKLYNSSKGSGGPKATLPDVQYLGEILKRSNFTPKKAYAVGGVRVQSFSDYIPRLVFDYLQMTADLSAKKLPAHAYSKEDIFVMQFGKTGIKINMSLVPAVAKDGIAPGLDKNGNYVWVDGHTFASDFHDKGSGQRGFELAVKIQNTEGYSQNCGTIAVGVSDEHIIKMLKDNDIRMVIPYHKSSLNHYVAQMGNIDQYKDYTSVQNTRDKATGKKIEGKDFGFNEAFHRLGDAKAATEEYLAWCEKNNYIPKFDTFAFHEDAEVRENYYKVLIDFAAYDSNGNATPQGPVTMNFPTENDAFGSMKSLIEKGLEADAILEGRKANDIPKILKEVKSVLGTEGKKYSLKTNDTNSSKNLEIKIKEEYNGNIMDDVLDKSNYIGYVPIRKVKMKTFPPYNESKSDANEWATRWAHREDVETGAQTLVFYHNRCYVIGKYESADLKYLIDGRISYSDYKSIKKELEEDARNRENQSKKKMVDFLRERNERRDSDEGRGQGLDYSSVKYGREDREVLRLGGNQGGKRGVQSDIGRSNERDGKDRKAQGLNGSKPFSLKDEIALLPEEDKEIVLAVRHRAIYSKGIATMTEGRLTEVYSEHGDSNPSTTTGYLAYIEPYDFIRLTTASAEEFLERNPQRLNEGVSVWGNENNIQKSGALYLRTDEDGNVIGHEGRHRMAGFLREGVDRVAVVIKTSRIDNAKPISIQKLYGQEFENSKSYSSVYIHNMIPISKEYENINKHIFGDVTEGNSFVKPNIRYSLKGTERDVSLKDGENVRKAVATKNADALAKYVESGAISTDVYNELIKEFGAIPKGENPYRDVSVPQKTEKNKKVSQTVRTILEAEATPDEAVPTVEKMVEDGVFSYDVYTDKQAIADSEAYIKEYGWDESLDDWFDAVNKGEVSKELTSMGWALYNNAANIAATTTSETERTSAIKTSLKILDAMVRHQRSAAQALQATRILKKLSPETQLYGVQKSVQALQNELADKYGKKAPDLKIDEELAERFINAKTPEERTEVEKEIYKDIGKQMPSRFIDKWNAWRYLAMLGNPRTHIRNIVGNAGFAPVVIAKDLTATAIESVVHRVSGKKTLRGKAIVWGSKADRSLLKAAWSDYKNVADLVSNGGKYNDFAMANQMIEEGRQIFKFKPLEWARKENSKALEYEDERFSKPHYAYALAQYCKANNITAEQIAKGVAIAPARDYAIKEAQKATYKDTNAFSQFVSELGRKGDKSNPVRKFASTVIEGILPFRKTPANILVRGLEYSPLGLLKGLSYDLVQVSKGNKTATEAIDNISAGLTGTGLLALGVYLAAQGVVRGHGEDEEKEKKFNEMLGHQSYALELPNGQSITLDWLAPEALPFFVGVNIWETTKGTDEEVNFSSILKSLTNISEPMLEMSCLQGLNDLFEGIGYASSNDTSGLMSVLSSAVTSYLTQGLPTLGGQAERTSEENRMTTYTEKNSFLTGDMQYTLGKASAKIPFWDYNQIPYIDAWGRKEASGTALKRGLNNFLNPAYTSTINTSKAEEELLRLYEMTGDGGIFPERADKYFMVDGERKDLTADEYVRYATLKGEKSYKMVSDLIGSKEYKNLSDAEKVSAIKNAYDYANQKAKEAISNYNPDKWVTTADKLGENVEDFVLFKTKVSSTRNENDGKISRQEVGDIITNVAENDTDAWKMYLSEYDSKDDVAASESGIDFADYATFKGATANVEGDGKRGTIVDTILKMEIDDDDAWELYLTEYSNSSTEYAINKGIKGNDYMEFLDMLDKVDQPTKSGKLGTYTQAEVTAAINQLKGLTRQEKADLWQSVNTTWKKNPFR